MMRVGLHGFGRVGRALIRHWIEISADVKVVFIRNSRHQWVSEEGFQKEELQSILDGDHGGEAYGEDLSSLLKRVPVDYLFELTPTDLSQVSETHQRIMEVLAAGISVIFANKGPVLRDYGALRAKADEMGVGLGLSAVMGASLPSYALMHYGAMGSKVLEIKGILNGTTNYLLSMMEEGKPFIESIERAVDEGIAESNYAYDVDGIDAAVKMSIIASVLEGRTITYKREDVSGIRSVTFMDFKEAESKHSKLKLIARYKDAKVTVSVEEVPFDDLYYHVNGPEKILTISTDKLSEMSVVGGRSGLGEVAASLHRDLLYLQEILK